MTDAGNERARDAALHNAKLLIVDDDPTDVEIARDMLEQAGYHAIQSISDPCESLSFSRTFVPDLIVLDLVMPKMDGLAVMVN